MKRLGVIAIGDEILAGHVHESNGHWVARTVRPWGIRLERITVCSDRLDDIDATVRRYMHEFRYDYIITSGGLGPTPDDRTLEGLARAFGVPLESREEHREWMRERVREGHDRGYFLTPQPNDGMWKMTYLPAGAHAMPNHVGTALGAILEGGPAPSMVFTLPGPPQEFQRMFEEHVAPRLERGAPIHTEELVLRSEESRFYGLLKEAEQRFGDLQVGSYPEKGQIRIRATGDAARAQEAIAWVRERVAQYVVE